MFPAYVRVRLYVSNNGTGSKREEKKNSPGIKKNVGKHAA